MRSTGINARRGSALLSVLWLTAALSAIAFSVANTVRGEVERSATGADGVRAEFLARGGVERALAWMQWSDAMNPDGTPRYWAPWMRSLAFEFPGGLVTVELIPEASKLNVNEITPEELLRMLAWLGVEPARASLITAGILDWRGQPAQGVSEFDLFYQAQVPSFRARHASIQEIEELLLIRGMTPELFHGTWQRSADGRLVPLAGLKECLSVFSGHARVDAATAPPPVLAGAGMPPDAIAVLVEQRRAMPIRSDEQLRPMLERLGPLVSRVGVMNGSMMTVRATARPRIAGGGLSDLRRTVSALVKFRPTTKDAPYHILRWSDQGGTGMEALQ